MFSNGVTLLTRATSLVIVATICLLALPVSVTAAASAPSFTSSHGLRVQGVKQIDARLFDVTVTSTAVNGLLHVRVLLPSGYEANPQRRYPVLYLFHGTSGGASDWTDRGDAENVTAGRNFITVMPDGAVGYSGGGWCTNWYNRGRGGKPMWETFHIDQLIPWIDGNLRTVASRAGREIFGLSQGGFCAFSYAARHPDMFLGAGSFSGAIDVARYEAAQAFVTPIVQITTTVLDGCPTPDAMFGPRSRNEINWAAHDPATLVANMRGMDLYAYAGNGRPGPLDPSGTSSSSGSQVIEAGVHELTTLWKHAADQAHVAVSYHDYGPGTHSWAYWARDLRDVIGRVSANFASPLPPPPQKYYTSAADPWSQWGYTVSVRRPAREFSTLKYADRSGFSLSGSGTATVTTPASYRPLTREIVHLKGRHLNRMLTVRSNRSGRLRIVVPLGPGNRHQEDTSAAQASGGTKVYSTRVTISRSRRS